MNNKEKTRKAGWQTGKASLPVFLNRGQISNRCLFSLPVRCLSLGINTSILAALLLLSLCFLFLRPGRQGGLLIRGGLVHHQQWLPKGFLTSAPPPVFLNNDHSLHPLARGGGKKLRNCHAKALLRPHICFPPCISKQGSDLKPLSCFLACPLLVSWYQCFCSCCALV